MEKDQTLGLSSALERVKMHHHIYEMYYVNKKSKGDIFQETGLSRSSFYRVLRTFESCNPQIAEEMKKQGKDVTPADYDKLKQEVALLKKRLATEKLRADFYEEMVNFGKEVYGIDLKKAGTK